VHDLTIHPRENDLVIGTYGRGVFIGDVTHLQELTAATLAKPLHLFTPEPRAAYQFRALGNFRLYGDKYLEVPNEPDAIVIAYYLRDTREGGARVTVTDIRGEQIAVLKGPSESGLHRVVWNMRRGGSGGGRGFGPQTPPLPPGDYAIVVSVGGEEQRTVGRIRPRLR
jgi:hypothetical protein